MAATIVGFLPVHCDHLRMCVYTLKCPGWVAFGTLSKVLNR